MWTVCNEARISIQDRVWLEANLEGAGCSKARIREMTYRALIDYLERLTA